MQRFAVIVAVLMAACGGSKGTGADFGGDAGVEAAPEDLALDLGRLRLRRRGSAGGHKGLASIISHLHSPDFPRLRLGIGAPPPGWDGVDWVLSRFAPQERPLADEAVANAAEAVEFLLREGIEAAMNRYN